MTDETQPTTLEERLLAARKRKSERDTKEDDENKARSLAILELEEELAAKFGRRGEDFEIIDGGPDGPLAVKLGEGAGYKRYRAKIMASKETQEDLIAFVNPCVVFPEAKKFSEIVGRRSALYDKLGAALLRLFGLWEGREEGK